MGVGVGGGVTFAEVLGRDWDDFDEGDVDHDSGREGEGAGEEGAVERGGQEDERRAQAGAESGA